MSHRVVTHWFPSSSSADNLKPRHSTSFSLDLFGPSFSVLPSLHPLRVFQDFPLTELDSSGSYLTPCWSSSGPSSQFVTLPARLQPRDKDTHTSALVRRFGRWRVVLRPPRLDRCRLVDVAQHFNGTRQQTAGERQVLIRRKEPAA